MRFLALVALVSACGSAQVKFPQPTVVEINGQPFTEFHKGEEVGKPYLAPLRSASGKIVTRRYPMEKIEGIRILSLDGLNGAGGGHGGRSATDEVIDSALRYRVQAPLIDSIRIPAEVVAAALEPA